MADITISQLSSGTPNKSSAEIPYSDGSTTYKTSPSGIVAASPGCLLQSLLKISIDAADSTNTTFIDIPNLSQTITPKSAASKILIQADIALFYATNNYIWAGLQLLRNNTIIYTNNYAAGMGVNIQIAPYVNTPIVLEDIVNTISPITYKVQFNRSSFAGSYGGTVGVGYSSRPSTLLIQEIAG